MDASLALLVGATFLLAGFVKGVIGLGLPTVAIGLLGLAMAPVEAAALLVVPSLVTNLWQMWGVELPALVRRLWPMMLAVVLGTFAGAGMLVDNPRAASLFLGLALVAYAGLGLAAVRPAVAPRHEPWLGPLVGGATGLVTGATGVFVIPAVPYLGALGLDKDALVRALGLSFTVSTLALAAALVWRGAFATSVVGASVLALAPALAGMALGRRVLARIRPEVFRRWFLIGLLAVGAQIVLRAL